MRLIATFDSEKEGKKCAQLLQKESIEVVVEEEAGRSYVWIKNEDDLPKARRIYSGLLRGEYSHIEIEEEKIPLLNPLPIKEEDEEQDGGVEEEQMVARPFWAPITRALILFCLFVFWMNWGWQQNSAAIYAFTPTQRAFFYDAPPFLEAAADLHKEYDLKTEEALQALPPEGQMRLKAIREEIVWRGFYNVLLDWKNRAIYFSAPLFTSIAHGEVWRLFTPIFLHSDWLHILFNMLWLWILGRGVELYMGGARYVAFIALTALVTNTLQYLMTGFFFMGFSGVISALAGYIWMRKEKAPWEVYPVDRITLIFLGVFIFGMLGIQMIAFFLQIFHIASFPIGLANTAHVSGALVGMALGRLNIFTKTLERV